MCQSIADSKSFYTFAPENKYKSVQNRFIADTLFLKNFAWCNKKPNECKNNNSALLVINTLINNVLYLCSRKLLEQREHNDAGISFAES